MLRLLLLVVCTTSLAVGCATSTRPPPSEVLFTAGAKPGPRPVDWSAFRVEPRYEARLSDEARRRVDAFRQVLVALPLIESISGEQGHWNCAVSGNGRSVVVFAGRWNVFGSSYEQGPRGPVYLWSDWWRAGEYHRFDAFHEAWFVSRRHLALTRWIDQEVSESVIVEVARPDRRFPCPKRKLYVADNGAWLRVDAERHGYYGMLDRDSMIHGGTRVPIESPIRRAVWRHGGRVLIVETEDGLVALKDGVAKSDTVEGRLVRGRATYGTDRLYRLRLAPGASSYYLQAVRVSQDGSLRAVPLRDVRYRERPAHASPSGSHVVAMDTTLDKFISHPPRLRRTDLADENAPGERRLDEWPTGWLDVGPRGAESGDVLRAP